jgi:hypothetical protein
MPIAGWIKMGVTETYRVIQMHSVQTKAVEKLYCHSVEFLSDKHRHSDEIVGVCAENFGPSFNETYHYSARWYWNWHWIVDDCYARAYFKNAEDAVMLKLLMET